MMTGLMDKRKRSREDDFCESTPLSKRINNLHINNLDESHFHQQEFVRAHHMNGLENVTQSSNGIHYPSHTHHNGNPMPQLQDDTSQMYSYSPELSANENPFYYYKNKLLHDLHFERVRRSQA